MDSTPALRRFMIHNLISDGPHLNALLTDDRELETYVRGRVVSAWHPSGSCRMGAADNPLGVVDPTGRVIGVDGYHLRDGSHPGGCRPVVLAISLFVARFQEAEE